MRTRPTSDAGRAGKTDEGAVRGRVAMARGGRRREMTGEGACEVDETSGREGRKAGRDDMHGQEADIVEGMVGRDGLGRYFAGWRGWEKQLRA